MYFRIGLALIRFINATILSLCLVDGRYCPLEQVHRTVRADHSHGPSSPGSEHSCRC
jgi:hypothetical protein